MKVKDLPKGTSLDGQRVMTPKGVVGYWKSQWAKGVWLSDGKTNIIYPQFVNDLLDCLEWEITDRPVNCHEKQDFESIDNCKKDE